MVGERGFEPPTPWSRTRCSTRLSHSPTVRGAAGTAGRVRAIDALTVNYNIRRGGAAAASRRRRRARHGALNPAEVVGSFDLRLRWMAQTSCEPFSPLPDCSLLLRKFVTPFSSSKMG